MPSFLSTVPRPALPRPRRLRPTSRRPRSAPRARPMSATTAWRSRLAPGSRRRAGSHLRGARLAATVSGCMEDEGRLLGRAVRNDVAAELSRRELIGRASSFGLGALVLGALPYLERMARPDGALAEAMPAEGT